MRPSATMIYIAVFVTFLNGNTISAAEILTSQEIITLIEGNSMCLTGERFFIAYNSSINWRSKNNCKAKGLACGTLSARVITKFPDRQVKGTWNVTEGANKYCRHENDLADECFTVERTSDGLYNFSGNLGHTMVGKLGRCS